MKLDYLSIWTTQFDKMQQFYTIYLQAGSLPLYQREDGYQSQLLEFGSGLRIKLKQQPGLDVRTQPPADHTIGFCSLTFVENSRKQVDIRALSINSSSHQLATTPMEDGEGFYAFETTDPDKNRLVVGTFSK